jgi:tetratricopeptide (TPR) repeat protein
MRKLVLGTAVALSAVTAGAAPAPWLEIKSGHFTVVTNAGEKSGRKVAWQFEQIRAALLQVWPWAKADSGRPFVIFAVRDEATLKTLGPQYWEGKRYRPGSFWTTGRDRVYVALRTDLPEPDDVGENPYRSAFWCYASAVFTRSFPQRLPAWYARGVADLMSNTIVREKELHVGRPIRGHLEVMRQQRAVPLGEFLTADERSRWLTQEVEAVAFEAQAWALVHYLMFGDKGTHSGKMNLFGRMLAEGQDAEVARREAFGDMKPYFDEMRAYVQRNLFSYVRIAVSTATRLESYATRALPPGESAAVRGEMLAAMNRPTEARAFAAEAAKADASLPGPWEIEAELLERENQRDQAKAALAKAAGAGSQRAHVYLRLAQLEWAPNADKALNEKLAARLEKARALEPTAANAHSFLAEVRLALGQNDEALELAKRAVELEPAESYHRLSLAHALWKTGRAQDAARIAETALKAASSEHERRRAQEFLDFLARAAKAQPPLGS